MATSFTDEEARRIAADFTLAHAPGDFIDDPYRYYAALRAHDPIHAIGPGQWLLTRYDDVSQIYREPTASSDKKREFAPKLGEGTPIFEHHTTSLVFSDPPLHTRVRRLILGAVNQRAIARMEPGLVTLVAQLLDALADREAPDLIDHFAAEIPLEVIGNLLDVPHAERAPLREWSLAILSALEPVPGAARLVRANAAVSEFIDYLRGLVVRRRANPGDPNVDVLTRLIEGESNGDKLSEAELLHNCIFLLNAGHETTTNLLGNGLHALLTHRDQWERLQGEPALIGTAVDELLRYEAPLQLNNRQLTAGVNLRGTVLPEGSFVTLGVGAANRDPAAFVEPDRLDIARKPNLHAAFGHGAHACAGMNVARLEGRIAIGAMVARYPGLELARAPVRDRRIRFRGFRHLPVRLAP
jgi:cytochrome P450